MEIKIRNESKKDFRTVEELTRMAFWNINEPGCTEHYLVHIMRNHDDFVHELDFVLEVGKRIVANIMYTKAHLIDEDGNQKDILTFGPLSVLPEYQRNGYGKKLLEHSFKKAVELGYDTIVIFGNPANYVSSGFRNCSRFNVSIEADCFPVPLLVKELSDGALSGKKWIYSESPVYKVDPREADIFDKGFETMEKGYQASQELFYIYSHSVVVI